MVSPILPTVVLFCTNGPWAYKKHGRLKKNKMVRRIFVIVRRLMQIWLFSGIGRLKNDEMWDKKTCTKKNLAQTVLAEICL
jgi:hypothetical protein